MIVLGSGGCLPSTIVTSDQIDLRLGKPAGWTFDNTGVAQRHVVAHETQIDLALGAARAALEDAGLAANALDLIISANGIAYQTLPSTAPLLQRGLGLTDGAVATFDVNSTCLSFLTALELADALLATGRYARALIVSAEIASRALPWDSQPEVAALFGDGAAAVVVERGQGLRAGLLAARFRSYPSGYEACEIGAGGTRFDFAQDRAAFEAHSRFRMDGRALFRLSAQHFVGFVEDLLRDAGLAQDQIDLVIPHQASPQALAHMTRLCGFEPDKVLNIASGLGNQIAASIPIGLDRARRSGRMPAGSRVLMLGTSAGVSFGGIVLEV